MDAKEGMRLTDRQEWQYGDEELIWAHIGPVMSRMRGKNVAFKRELYEPLSKPMRSLAMMQILIGHTKSGAVEFYQSLWYLLMQNGFWNEMQKAAKFFSDFPLYSLLLELEQMFIHIMQNGETEGNPKMFAQVRARSGMELDCRLAAVMPNTIRNVAAYIRAHASEFAAADA